MSDAIFYTCFQHKSIYCKGASSTATGYDKHHVLDWNLDTAWKPSSATGYVYFDCGTATTVDAFGVWIRNYNTNYSSSSIYLWGTNSNPAVSGNWVYQSGSKIIPTNGVPLNIDDLSSPLYWRYYIIGMEDSSVAPEFGHIFLFRKRTITNLGYGQYPWADTHKFDNTVTSLSGDRTVVTANWNNYVSTHTRNYDFVSETKKNMLQTAHDDCNGRLRFLAIQESDDDPYLCRFDDDELKAQRQCWELYKFNFNVTTIPYIEAGETM